MLHQSQGRHRADWRSADTTRTSSVAYLTPRGRVLGFSDRFWSRVAVRNTNRTTHSTNKSPEHERSRVLLRRHRFPHSHFGSIYDYHIIGFCSKLLSFG